MRKSKFNTWQAAAISKDVEADMGVGGVQVRYKCSDALCSAVQGLDEAGLF